MVRLWPPPWLICRPWATDSPGWSAGRPAAVRQLAVQGGGDALASAVAMGVARRSHGRPHAGFLAALGQTPRTCVGISGAAHLGSAVPGSAWADGGGAARLGAGLGHPENAGHGGGRGHSLVGACEPEKPGGTAARMPRSATGQPQHKTCGRTRYSVLVRRAQSQNETLPAATHKPCSRPYSVPRCASRASLRADPALLPTQ